MRDGLVKDAEAEVIEENKKTLTICFCFDLSETNVMVIANNMNIIREMAKADIDVLFNVSTSSKDIHNTLLGASRFDGIDQKPLSGKVEYDYIVFLGKDIIAPTNSIVEIIKHMEENRDVDVMSALVPCIDGKAFEGIIEYNEGYLKENGCFESFPREEIVNYKETGCKKVRAEAITMDCCVIRSGVIEHDEVKYPWFDKEAVNVDGKIVYLDENIGFCNKVKDAGYNIFINLNSIVRRIIHGGI